MEISVPGYRVERLLAYGGFGSVLLCSIDADPVSKAAVKVAHPNHPSAGPQLSHEARVLSAVGPPVTPAPFASGKLVDGTPFLAMELVATPTLASRLEEIENGMSLAEFAQRAQSILTAVGLFHEKGWLHGDLKPENIFLVDPPAPARLCDFGLSMRLNASPLHVDGTFVGTAEYMSPERCQGNQVADVRCDIYSLGVVFYEMLTGKTPFWGSTADVRQAHQTRRPPRPSELSSVSPGLEELILRCLDKDPGRRFESITELTAALSQRLAESHSPRTLREEDSIDHRNAVLTAQARVSSRPMGLVFLDVRSADIQELRYVASTFGGDLAHVQGRHAVVVFDSTVTENPVRRGLLAAQALVGRGLGRSAILDLSPIATQTRSDGTARYLSNLFWSEDRYPTDSALPSLMITTAAADMLPDLRTRSNRQRPDLLELETTSVAEAEATVVRVNPNPLVGRGELIAELVAGAQRAVKQSVPTIATVIADAGYGKTHLAAALVSRLQRKLGSVEILQLRARECVAGDASELYRNLVKLALRLPNEIPEDGGESLIGDRLGPKLAAELGPTLAFALGWGSDHHPEVQSLAAAPGALRSMMVRCAGEALRSQSRNGGLCLVIDDAHFADDLVLDALEFAALAECGLPIWLCVLARPRFISSRPSWGERAGLCQASQLQPLDSKSAGELARRLLLPAENIPAKAIERLIDRTHGIPFLLVELARGLKRDGLIRRHAQSDAWYLATDELDRLPSLASIEWLATRELDALPSDLASHARLLAILGVEFTLDEAQGLLLALEQMRAAEEYPIDARVAVRALTEAGILVPTRQHALMFRNPLIRDVAARAVPHAQQRRIHLAALAHYQSDSRLTQDRRVSRLALHAGAAGLNDLAAVLYLQLAEQARGRHAYFEAERLYSQALAHLASDDLERRLVSHRGRGLMRYRLGRYGDSLLDFYEGRRAAQTLNRWDAEIEILLDEATALDWMGDYRKSSALVREAKRNAKDHRVASKVIDARISLGLARIEFRFSRWAKAAEKLEISARQAEGLGDAGYETYVVSLLMLGPMLAYLNRIEQAERVYDRAIGICSAHGDRLHLAATLNNRRILWTARKDLANAIRDQQEYIGIVRELGLVGREINGEGNLGELLYQKGDLHGAWPHVERAVALERKHPEAFPRPAQLLLRARLLAYEGREAEARSVLEEIQAVLERARSEGRSNAALIPSEQVLWKMVDLATRNADDQQWAELLQRGQQFSVDQESIEVVEMRGLAALRRGDLAIARQALLSALELSQRIPNIMEERIRKWVKLVESLHANAGRGATEGSRRLQPTPV